MRCSAWSGSAEDCSREWRPTPPRRPWCPRVPLRAEFSVGGVLVPAFMVWAIAAFVVLLPLRRAFIWLRVYRLVWHRSLFDLGFYLIVLYAIALGAARWTGP